MKRLRQHQQQRQHPQQGQYQQQRHQQQRQQGRWAKMEIRWGKIVHGHITPEFIRIPWSFLPLLLDTALVDDLSHRPRTLPL